MKNPWPLALTVICAGAFSFAVYIAVTMIRQKVDLVATDYYDKDVQHEKRMAQQERTRALDRQIEVTQIPGAQQLVISFPHEGASGTITMYRPSDSTLDQKHEIKPDADQRQILSYAGMASGLWNVQIEWQQGGQDYYYATQLVLP